MRYVRCRTCGKYIEPTSALRQVYCSEACSASFARCATCGAFFPAGSGYDEEICSQACSIRYAIHRLHGAQATGAQSEEMT